jgi:hypothetical protein
LNSPNPLWCSSLPATRHGCLEQKTAIFPISRPKLGVRGVAVPARGQVKLGTVLPHWEYCSPSGCARDQEDAQLPPRGKTSGAHPHESWSTTYCTCCRPVGRPSASFRHSLFPAQWTERLPQPCERKERAIDYLFGIVGQLSSDRDAAGIDPVRKSCQSFTVPTFQIMSRPGSLSGRHLDDAGCLRSLRYEMGEGPSSTFQPVG